MKQKQILEPIKINLKQKIIDTLKEKNYDLEQIEIEDKIIFLPPFLKEDGILYDIIISYLGEYDRNSLEMDGYNWLIRYIKNLDFGKWKLTLESKYGSGIRKLKKGDDHIMALWRYAFMWNPDVLAENFNEDKIMVKAEIKRQIRNEQGLPSKTKDEVEAEKQIERELEKVEKEIGDKVTEVISEIINDKPCKNKNKKKRGKKKIGGEDGENTTNNI